MEGPDIELGTKPLLYAVAKIQNLELTYLVAEALSRPRDIPIDFSFDQAHPRHTSNQNTSVSARSACHHTSALLALKKAGPTPLEFLARHVRELCEEDRKENELSLERDFRLLSSYRVSSCETKVWVIHRSQPLGNDYVESDASYFSRPSARVNESPD